MVGVTDLVLEVDFNGHEETCVARLLHLIRRLLTDYKQRNKQRGMLSIILTALLSKLTPEKAQKHN